MSQFAALFKALKNEEEKPTAEPSALTKEKQVQMQRSALKETTLVKGRSKTLIHKSSAQDKNRKPVIVTEQPYNTSTKKKETKVMLTAEKPVEKRRGKSSNPEYIQALSYIRKNTYKEVKRVLLDEPEQDFSELIENLLSEWLTNKT